MPLLKSQAVRHSLQCPQALKTMWESSWRRMARLQETLQLSSLTAVRTSSNCPVHRLGMHHLCGCQATFSNYPWVQTYRARHSKEECNSIFNSIGENALQFGLLKDIIQRFSWKAGAVPLDPTRCYSPIHARLYSQVIPRKGKLHVF